MLLTLNNVHHHLIFQGLISAKELVLGKYCVEQLSTRNNILMVTTEDKQYFIKQMRDHESGARYRIQKDATCLYLIQDLDEYASLKPYVAEYHGYFSDHTFLITDLFRNAITLEEYIRKNKTLSALITTQIVDILKAIHVPIIDQIQSSKSLQFFPQTFPWILEIDKTPILQYEEAHAGQEIVIQHMLRYPIFIQCLDEAKFIWEKKSLIHGDIKYLNFIITDDEDVKIVDWEYSDIGDPLWDVAGLFQNILCDKILMNTDHQNGDFIHHVISNELELEWNKIALLWDQYNTNEDLKKALIFTSSRLLQTAIEHNIRSREIIPSVKKILNTAIYIYTNIDAIAMSIASHLKNIHAK